MSKRLRCLGLEKEVINRLHKHNLITCKDVLSRNSLDLLNLLNLSYFTVLDVVDKASRACAPTAVTALDLLLVRQKEKSNTFIKTSLELFDCVLRGGIPSATITEIAGPSGCGKTQFCLMMTVQALLLDDICGVVYIDTESAFDAFRLVEIASSRCPDVFETDESLKLLASRVVICNERTCSDLMKRLEHLEEVVTEHKARLVIVDSIASLVRKEFDPNLSKNMIERTKLLSKQAAILKLIAENYSIPILVTNQVTTHFVQKRGPSADDLRIDVSDSLHNETDDGYVTVALGNTWSHCVNTRLIVQFVDDKRREILVAKSPVAPFIKFIYTIEDKGIVLEDEGADQYQGTDPGLQMIKIRSAATSDVIT